ncbi:nuclear transport factor 2 family protein [Umezawaea tangerina]|uniref:Ketosteroid isomerase-like protein n=1 Tax=Umezawaea tangerina TaxID=84725 RepID=A0A2T0T2F6_9PSEU|nr:nuclear transport factor 2 family protein [Umezawaea tangerina]PRY39824.1 ketosteroid isomerase-like protein [Umezawaea tangerina]
MHALSDEARRERARERFDRALALLVDHDMEAFAHLWAPEGTMDFPFAVDGQPERLEGRQAVVDYLAHYTDMVDVRAVEVHAVHPMLDPDTIVVEFEASGVVVATGLDYAMPYIAVITVGDEGITSYRDYWTLARIASSLPAAAVSA